MEGKISHILDVAYAFQKYNRFLPAADVDIAEAFVSAIISVTTDDQPGWTSWSQESPENYKVLGNTTRLP